MNTRVAARRVRTAAFGMLALLNSLETLDRDYDADYRDEEEDWKRCLATWKRPEYND